MFDDQRTEGNDEIGSERDDTSPTAFPVQKRLWPGPIEREVGDSLGQRLGHPSAGASEEQQQRPIATAL
jgi:hypothetical protein